MKALYVIALVVLGFSAAGAFTINLLGAKKTRKSAWTMPATVACIALFFASTAFLLVGAATNQLAAPPSLPRLIPRFRAITQM